jgi:tetratricopeptide (TPR) repeat protein
VKDQPQPFEALDPKALEIIRLVLDGKITPQEGATRLTQYWVPKELIRSEALPLILQTRPDSLVALDRTVVELSNQGLQDQARRLAEMNWIFATRLGDEELMVLCASTLAQMMIGDPSATNERLALLEFAVPKVADARFTQAADNSDLLQATIEACQKALALNAPLEDFWLGRLHFLAGTAYNTIGGSIENLLSSIHYFKEALKHYRGENYLDEYASTLNNLGNSYRDLGARTKDRKLLREAIACYKEALPLRRDEHLRLRTEGNMAVAEKILAQLDRITDSVDTPETVETSSSAAGEKDSIRFKELLKIGDDAFNTSLIKEEKATQFRQRAAEKYVDWMSSFGRTAGAADRAEGFHRLAVLFLHSTEDDALWTGLCFASTAQRLSLEVWSPLGQARLASHRGQMLMKIGYPRGVDYLSLAESLLCSSIIPLRQLGHAGEAEQASQYLTITDGLLAVSGNTDAQKRVMTAYSDEGMKRLKVQIQTTQIDELHKVYCSYLSLVQKVAAPELSELLGKLGLEVTRARLDDFLDEFNRAFQLVQTAAKHREIGDLDGALSAGEEAEDFAAIARYSASSIWCELAKFYSLIPLRDQALRCIEKAQAVMSMIAKEGEYVSPGESGGRWMAEGPVETYQAEIAATKALIDETPATPYFDAARTAELLSPKDELRRQNLERTIREGGVQIGLNETIF